MKAIEFAPAHVQTLAAHYHVRLAWAIAWRYATFALAIVGMFWLGGCAAPKAYAPTAYDKDKAECEAAAAPARAMAAYAIYRDCMRAKGWTK